jgi:hypothetical protein
MQPSVKSIASGLACAVLLNTLLAACARPAAAPATAPIASTAARPSNTAPVVIDTEAPAGADSEFNTDFTKRSVPNSEILSGGPPKDGIPAIDAPAFVSIADASAWLRDNESVVRVVINGDARAYPVQILTWHEIVNDEIGGVPLAVTYCPLCNTAIAFERRFDDKLLDFGTTGRLRFSNMIMYDRQTETWWQQGTGAGIAGEYTGRTLAQRPIALIAWADFKSAHPHGKVLNRDPGSGRSYGINPYPGYDNPRSQPFLYRGPDTPSRLPALARVLTLNINGDAAAVSYDALSVKRVVSATVGGQALVVFWAPGASSPLDTQDLAAGRDIGAALSFVPVVNGQTLAFEYKAGALRDVATGSSWTHLGNAVDGPLKGTQLSELTAVNHFWFSWVAFYPETRLLDP